MRRSQETQAQVWTYMPSAISKALNIPSKIKLVKFII
jgi:hypothetical protein